MSKSSFPKLNVLGIDVDKVNRAGAIDAFRGFMATEGTDMIVTPNPEIILNATKDAELRGILETASLVIPDGIGLVYASRILKDPLEERLTGVDFLSDILSLSAENGWRVYLLGAKPGVAEAAKAKMEEKYPGLCICGTHDGYFKAEEEDALAEAIAETKPDFLCVAMGSPKQEKFVERHKDVLRVKAAMGVGGSLDVWAGTAKRAPEFYQKHGLEWLYRLIQEPSRIGRMMALPKFMLKVIFTK